MQKINDRFCEHTTYSGTTYSGSITKGETMTRKHFKAIAEDINTRATVVVFSQELSSDEKYIALHTLKHLAYDLGSTFSKFNDNFDYDKFIKACNVGEIPNSNL